MLNRAYQRNRKALVTVEYLTDGALKHKEITVARLARRELHALSLPNDRLSDRRCRRAVYRELSNVLSGRTKPTQARD